MLAITQCRLKIGNASYYSMQVEARQSSLLLGADWSCWMLAITRCRIFCLPFCYPKL